MVVDEKIHLQSLAMAKNGARSDSKTSTFASNVFLYVAGVLVASMVFWVMWVFFDAQINTPHSGYQISGISDAGFDSSAGCDFRHDPPERNFYDDPEVNYTIESGAVRNWDEKRAEWLRQHPSFIPGAENRIVMVTGSQATPCKSSVGDYLLLRLFKNKVDYCRRHGIDIFYNNVLLQPKMYSFWAKTPIVKAAMMAHPEAEWIWWVDADAVITDMDFTVPLRRYRDHNLVVHGWRYLLNQEKKSWTSVNAGVFLIRNSQWGMDLLETWARMGPQSPEYEKWGITLQQTFQDKIFPESDDQSGLIYLLINDTKWGNKAYIESEYYFEGYWSEIVDELEKIDDEYRRMENSAAALRRRHAEKVSERYGDIWEEKLEGKGQGKGSLRRPFITHFTGCQPCSGSHNQIYSGKTCFDSMQKALIFADNQVLRNYGFYHPHLLDPSSVVPMPFDFPHKHD